MARDLAYIDRAGMPKNPGDRRQGHGDATTLEVVEGAKSVSYETSLTAGDFVNFDGEGGIYRPATPDNSDDPLTYDAVVQHDAELGDEVAVHLRGSVRVGEEPSNGTNGPTENRWPVLRKPDSDFIVALR